MGDSETATAKHHSCQRKKINKQPQWRRCHFLNQIGFKKKKKGGGEGQETRTDGPEMHQADTELVTGYSGELWLEISIWDHQLLKHRGN